MKLQIFPSTGSLIPVDIDNTQLTYEILNTLFSNSGIEVSDNMVVTFGFRTPEGAINRGTFDETTILSADIITLSISMRETKSASETDEVIEIAKQALISGNHRGLITTCYILFRYNDGQFKSIIGNYTNKSFSELEKVITEVLDILQPTEVTNDALELIQKIETKVNRVMEVVETFETRITNLESADNGSDNSEVETLRSDLAYVANHFKIALPNHLELFEQF